MLAEKLKNWAKYSNYSPHVKKIVEHEENGKNIRVIAGAGSGKTETLTLRIVNLLLLKKAKPEEIVAFTFTEKAANSLQSRIYSRVQEVGDEKLLNSLGNMYIGTIHAYCLQLLQDKYGYGGFSMLDEVSQNVYVQKHSGKLGFFTEDDRFEKEYSVPSMYTPERPKKFLQSYEILLDEELDLNVVRNARPKFMEKVDFLEKEMFEKDRVLTFGQLIKLAIEKLEINREPVKNLKYLFVDEFQDVNKAQEHLVRLLGEDVPELEKQTEVFVVGDPKQSIYHWRGSRLESFLKFEKLIDGKEVKTFTIPENWRSLKNIVLLSNEFSDQYKINEPTLKADPKRLANAGFVSQLSFAKRKDEADWIIAQIKELIKTGYIQYRDIAILCRSVKGGAKEIIKACVDNKIPYVIGGKVGLFRRLEVNALIEFIAWVYEKGFWKEKGKKISGDELVEKGINNWIQACNEADFNHGLTNDRICKILDEWKKYWLNYINSVRKQLENKNVNALDKACEEKPAVEAEIFNEVIEQDRYDGEIETNSQDIGSKSTQSKTTKQKSVLLDFVEYLKGGTYVDMLYDLLKRLEVKKMDLTDDLHATMLANIGKLSEILNTFEFTFKRGGSAFIMDTKINSLCHFLYANNELFEEMQGDDLRYINAIQIFTVHQAKGLEWPIVFIPGLQQNVFPTQLKSQLNYITPTEKESPLYEVERYESNTKDEARLFYVAMTRAKNVLIMSTTNKKKQSEFIKIMAEKPELSQYVQIMTPKESIIRLIPPEEEFKTDLSDEFEEYAITDILKYKQCPTYYCFNKVWNFSPLLNRMVGFGTSLHHCLRELVKKTETEHLNLTDKDATDAELSETIKKSFLLPYLGKGINETMQKAASKIIKAYVSDFGGQLNCMNSLEARLEFVDEKAIVKGIADILINDVEVPKSIHVRDYKTEKPKTDDSDPKNVKYDEERIQNFEMQIQLYAIALRSVGYEIIDGSLGYLRDKKNDPVDLSGEKLDAIFEETREIVGKIKNREYREGSSGKGPCSKKCDYQHICPRHRSN